MDKSSLNASFDALHLSVANSYQDGVRAGLEMAAKIADHHAALQHQYADECDVVMPKSAQAFLMQKVAATQIATKIREIIHITLKAGIVIGDDR